MSKKILVIDEDKNQLSFVDSCLSKQGYKLELISDSSLAMRVLKEFKPNLILLDLMMPNISGIELIKMVREIEKYNLIKIIVLTSKSFHFDKKQAYALGANGYLIKPTEGDELIDYVSHILAAETQVTFWGTRGTVPTPNKDFLTYGGNTSCVSVQFPKEQFFVFDAGTGIINLGNKLMELKKQLKVNILISHPHWDHIQGLPFFEPAYAQGNEIAIAGSPHGKLSLREVISGQMESIYFPITINEYGARVYFKELLESEYVIDDITINTIMLNHPGNTLGYKLTDGGGKSVAYITDNELNLENSPLYNSHFRKKLERFIDGVDMLIHDSCYFDEEYKTKVGWGHPPLTAVLELAANANVKSLYLFHHDPSHNDDKVAEKERLAIEYFKKKDLDIPCFAAREGTLVNL